MNAPKPEPPGRSELFARLRGETLDLLILGGGIVGAGLARDAALRGLRVGLVEQGDFASGTSSRSSRLLHGGLRYLAQGRLGLVREAQREKRILARIAPHLAAPLPFIFPAYRGTPWPLWKLRLGVKVYDWLCGREGNLGRSAALGREETLARLPGLNAAGLAGAVRYYDGFTNDARLVLDTLRSAARHGAWLANYTRFESAAREGGVFRCQARDVESGEAFTVRARAVASAAGSWAPRLPQNTLKLRLTKGVHLVVDRARLPVSEAVVLQEGPRILFVIPWGERLILGTTDTDFTGAPEDVRTEAEDVRYILGVVGAAFPGVGLKEADVRADWAGLRPLIATGSGGPSDISRRHVIRMAEPGWFELAGGKLTTYRLMAEQAADRIVEYLGLRAAPCRTAEELLLPADEVEGISGLVPPPVSRALVEHYCRAEWARRPEDILLRRTSWHYYLPDRERVRAQVVEWMGT